MGYRLYFHKISKNEIKEIKSIKNSRSFYEWGKNKGYEVIEYNDDEEPYLPIYNIGKCLYNFGKDVDWAFMMQGSNESIFGNDELKEYYEHYSPVICSKEDFLKVIDEYKKKIIRYYENLLTEKEDFFGRKLTIEQKCREHTENQLSEWKNDFGISPVDTDLTKDRITGSWLYEYSIFELVRLYKTFDWENDALILLGW